MNKMAKLFIGLASIFSLVLLGTGVFSRGYSDDFPTMPMANTFKASWFIGHRVVTPMNTYLGQVTGLVVDRTNGRIALVVLSDVPNVGAERLAIPFNMITNIGQDTAEFYPGNWNFGPSLEPNYVINSDPYVYQLTLAGHPEIFRFKSSMDIAWLDEVYRAYGQVPYWEVEGQPEPSSLELIDSSRLMGAQVQLSSGEAAGEIHDFIVDASGGQIAFVVLSDVPGRPDIYVAVPFSTLSTRENVYVLSVTGDQLVSAMSFNEEDLNNPRWASSVYLYFGVTPYWIR